MTTIYNCYAVLYILMIVFRISDAQRSGSKKGIQSINYTKTRPFSATIYTANSIVQNLSSVPYLVLLRLPNFRVYDIYSPEHQVPQKEGHINRGLGKPFLQKYIYIYVYYNTLGGRARQFS